MSRHTIRQIQIWTITESQVSVRHLLRGGFENILMAILAAASYLVECAKRSEESVQL
jgi:hypothetical protein